MSTRCVREVLGWSFVMILKAFHSNQEGNRKGNVTESQFMAVYMRILCILKCDSATCLDLHSILSYNSLYVLHVHV